MNKYQKAESRLIKRYMRAFRKCGIDNSYKFTRKRIRKFLRWYRAWQSGKIPVCNEIRPLVSNNPSNDGLRAKFMFIDEMSYYNTHNQN